MEGCGHVARLTFPDVALGPGGACEVDVVGLSVPGEDHTGHLGRWGAGAQGRRSWPPARLRSCPATTDPRPPGRRLRTSQHRRRLPAELEAGDLRYDPASRRRRNSGREDHIVGDRLQRRHERRTRSRGDLRTREGGRPATALDADARAAVAPPARAHAQPLARPSRRRQPRTRASRTWPLPSLQRLPSRPGVAAVLGLGKAEEPEGQETDRE